MDHRWGRNLLDDGLWGTGATVASRVLANPLISLTNVRHPFTHDVIGWLVPSDMSTPYTIVPFSGVPLGAHFPYGIGVQPDVPM